MQSVNGLKVQRRPWHVEDTSYHLAWMGTRQPWARLKPLGPGWPGAIIVGEYMVGKWDWERQNGVCAV